MTVFIIIVASINILFFLGLVAFLTKVIYSKSKKDSVPDKEQPYRLNWQTIFALAIAFLLVGFSFYAPFLFTREAANSDFNFTLTGQIGDTIGGLMNPFIALAGVIVTGLAFYMQYRANLIQRQIFNDQLIEGRKQFEEQISRQASQNTFQQFETHFYEMLRLHKENVNEIEIPMRKSTQNNSDSTGGMVTKRNAFVEFKLEFEIILDVIESMGGEINKKTIEDAYGIFFWGLDKKYDMWGPNFNAEFYNDDPLGLKSRLGLFRSSNEQNSNQINSKINLFEGHSGLLGHYFRHLFLTVKFVVTQDFLSYTLKIKYLRILRAQLSNHEQIMLFYNWLGRYGKPWENKKNRFFTEYKMIHNLWYDTLFDNEYIHSKVDYLRKKKVLFREKEMFEIADF